MVNIKKQAIFSILIAIGAIVLLYDIATENEMVELKIGGLVILMIGLYGSTRQWVTDNKKDTSNDTEGKNETKLIDGSEEIKNNSQKD